METSRFFGIVLHGNSHIYEHLLLDLLCVDGSVCSCYLLELTALYIVMRPAAYWALQPIEAFRIQTKFSWFAKNETFLIFFFNDHIFSQHSWRLWFGNTHTHKSNDITECIYFAVSVLAWMNECCASVCVWVRKRRLRQRHSVRACSSFSKFYFHASSSYSERGCTEREFSL